MKKEIRVSRSILSAVLLAGFAAWSHMADAAQPESDQALLARGAYLAAAADCAACHTVHGGAPFAGGLKMQTPMGAIFSTNITPDKRTGIGDYTEADFSQAVRKGVAKDGHNLYPAMPYPSYSKLTDADVSALYRYFMRGVLAVHQENVPSTIPWPLSYRWPLKIWSTLFADDRPFTPRTGKSAEWNRGAYLVQSLGHCGACHTARGVAFQENAYDESGSAFLAGAPLDGWFASNLSGDVNTGLGKWTVDDIKTFLHYGANAHASAFGPMTTVINHSTQWLNDGDRQAIAVYLKSLPAANPAPPVKSVSETVEGTEAMLRGAKIYSNFCVACHAVNGAGTSPYLAPLTGNPNVLEPNPQSLINITLNGTDPLVIDGKPAAYPMPAHRMALSDAEVADVLTYVRNSWGNQAPVVDVKDVAALRRQTGNGK